RREAACVFARPAGREELESHSSPLRLLEVVEVISARRRLAQIRVFGVFRDAYDFNLQITPGDEATAYGAFIAEEVTRHRLIDDGVKRRNAGHTRRRAGLAVRRRRRTLILRSEITSREDGHLHRLEEPWPHGHFIATHIFIRRWRIAGDDDIEANSAAAQQTGRLRAGQGFRPREHSFVEVAALLSAVAAAGID